MDGARLRAALRPTGRRQVALTVVVVLLLAIGLLGLVAHFYPAGRVVTLAIVAVAPYLMVAAPVALIVALAGRLWLPAVVGAMLTAACLATQVHLYTTTTPPRDAIALTTMTANLHLGQASAADVVREVRRHDVDVLMLQELTLDEQQALHAAGLDTVLPHHASKPYAGGGAGTGLWSRYPLSDTQDVPGFGFALITARARIPGLNGEPTLVALHMSGPVPYPPRWTYDIAHLPALLRSLPGDAPVIVGGDFNATPDFRQFRALLTGGFADAADQAGVGLTRTYPANTWYPPLLAIDHVITRGATARSVTTVQLSHTDHRALVVRLAVRGVSRR